MAAFLLVLRRRRKRLIGPLCSKAPIQWWCRRVFCPRAKPPPLVQAPTPTPALPPSKHPTRSAGPRPPPLTGNLRLLPAALPDLPCLPLSITLHLPHTRRRRTPALHARPQGPKLGDHLWMPNSLPSSSSSSAATPEELEPKVGNTLHWASWTYSRLLSSSWSNTTNPSTLRLPGNTPSSDPATVLFLQPGAN